MLSVKFAKGQLFHNGRNPFSFSFFHHSARPPPAPAGRGARLALGRTQEQQRDQKVQAVSCARGHYHRPGELVLPVWSYAKPTWYQTRILLDTRAPQLAWVLSATTAMATYNA